MNKWQVNINNWQVNITIWQDDKKIWHVNIIIWQLMTEICHHTVLPNFISRLCRQLFKKRPMGHIAYLKNISTHMIISYHWLEEENTHAFRSFVRIELLLFFIWQNLNPLHPRILRANFDWNRPSNFLNFVNFFLLFRSYLLLEKGGTLPLNKFESPLPKDALC